MWTIALERRYTRTHNSPTEWRRHTRSWAYNSPGGAAAYSQGIHPLVPIPNTNKSPNGAMAGLSHETFSFSHILSESSILSSLSIGKIVGRMLKYILRSSFMIVLSVASSKDNLNLLCAFLSA